MAMEGVTDSSISQAQTGHVQGESTKTMAVTGISSIWFSVTDWQRAKTFYEKVFGFRPAFCNDDTGVVAYHPNATDPPIFLIKKPVESAKHSLNAPRTVIHGGTVGFNVANAAEIMKQVAAFGGSVSDKVDDGFDSRVYTIYDPDGNVLELAELKKPESEKK